jgi:hypothetical protein
MVREVSDGWWCALALARRPGLALRELRVLVRWAKSRRGRDLRGLGGVGTFAVLPMVDRGPWHGVRLVLLDTALDADAGKRVRTWA